MANTKSQSNARSDWEEGLKFIAIAKDKDPSNKEIAGVEDALRKNIQRDDDIKAAEVARLAAEKKKADEQIADLMAKLSRWTDPGGDEEVRGRARGPQERQAEDDGHRPGGDGGRADPEEVPARRAALQLAHGSLRSDAPLLARGAVFCALAKVRPCRTAASPSPSTSHTAQAEALAARVAAEVGVLKIGLELFVAEGPAVLALGARHQRDVFLDSKLHDIPETVERAVASAAKLGARYLTVHAAGGPEMLPRSPRAPRRRAAGGCSCWRSPC